MSPSLGALPWRVGRRVGRTLYDANGILIGMLDTAALALSVVLAVNAHWSAKDPDEGKEE